MLESEQKQKMDKKQVSCSRDAGEDRKILEYILRAEPEEYDGILEKDGSWPAQYRLSPMRASLLSWYPFGTNATVLEIGGAFGELTHILCEKCAHVTSVERDPVRAQAVRSRCRRYENLEVCSCDIRDFLSFVTCNSKIAGLSVQGQQDVKYDYVIAAGILESCGTEGRNLGDYVEFLAFLKSFLKPSGKLLLSCENRMGIRNLCGEWDRKTGIPFGGIRMDLQEQGAFGFTRMELEDILAKAGFEAYQFFYPLPDDKMVQAVYAERDLPKDSIRDRVIPYYRDKHSVVASQLDLMDFCIQSGCLHVFANSFLIECILNGGSCTDIQSAFFTVDRGMDAAMATVHKGEYMYKEALYPQGVEGLRCCAKHAEDLMQHGIRVVPHTWVSERRIRMPYVKAPLMMSVLRDALKKDRECFASLLDQIWTDICRSSDVRDAADLPGDLSFLQQGRGEDWGPVLKNAYFDMVPMNCFYDQGEILYFDQEFVKYDYPAKYTMFRVILYTYIHIPEADEVVPRAGMLSRYGISSVMWDIFFREEAAFIAALRKHRVFQHFHEMSQVSYEEMRQNAKRLAGMPQNAKRPAEYRRV